MLSAWMERFAWLWCSLVEEMPLFPSSFTSTHYLFDFLVLCNPPFLFLKAKEWERPTAWLPRCFNWQYVGSEHTSCFLKTYQLSPEIWPFWPLLSMALATCCFLVCGTRLSPCPWGSRRYWGWARWGPSTMMYPPLQPHGYFILRGKILNRLILGSWSANNKLHRQGPIRYSMCTKNHTWREGHHLGGPTYPSRSYSCQMASKMLLGSAWPWGKLGRRVGRAKCRSSLWPPMLVGNENRARQMRSGSVIASPIKRWFGGQSQFSLPSAFRLES